MFALAGYVLSRKGTVNREHAKLLSALCVYVFLPATVFKSYSSNFTVSYIRENYFVLLVSLAVLLVVTVISGVLARMLTKEPFEQNIYKYSLIVPNYGYMGYALAESLFGSVGLFNLMIFALPMSFYVYTVGFCILPKTELKLKKLINPVMIAIFLGCIFGLAGWTIPDFASQILDKGSVCVAPVSMLLTGMTISEFSLKKLFGMKKLYLVTALRLLVFPCLIAWILQFFCPTEVVTAALILYAMPCGLNTIVFPKLVGENCEIGAGLACISSVLSCLTIPLCIELLL